MFLDNVVNDSANVTKPWHQYKISGNSLFLWRLCFGLICFFIFLLFIIVSFIIGFNYYENSYYSGNPFMLIFGMGLLFLTLIIITSYISMFLNSFVVPLMYKNSLTTNKAWGLFLPLLSKHLIYFLIYGLFIFILYLFVIVAVILVGLFTCCIGLLLIIIPYIGSVVLLPISYSFRAYSLEFLEQFGSNYKIFPEPEIISGNSQDQNEIMY